jgi:hypothetical protein
VKRPAFSLPVRDETAQLGSRFIPGLNGIPQIVASRENPRKVSIRNTSQIFRMLVFHQELFPVDSDSQAQLVRPDPYVWGLYLLVPLVDSGSRFWDRLTEKTGSFGCFAYRKQSRFLPFLL